MGTVPRGDLEVHFNPLNAELNPICHLLALLGAHHILHVSRIRVKSQLDTNRSSQDALLPDLCPACVTKRRLLFNRLITCCIRRRRLSRRVCVPGNAKWNFCANLLSLCTRVRTDKHSRTQSQHAATAATPKRSKELFCFNGESLAPSGPMRRVAVDSVYPLCANTHAQ